jgi:VIT1/CCC1 family predicted Fe2+/Mn2+ transporter
MALGEYVSVSSQRDSEHAQIAQETANSPRRRKPR